MRQPQRMTTLPTPEELGLNLEEDSTDVTDEELAQAVETSDGEDLAKQIASFLEGLTGTLDAQLRRKGGILYCRASCGGSSRLYQVEWVRRSKHHG